MTAPVLDPTAGGAWRAVPELPVFPHAVCADTPEMGPAGERLGLASCLQRAAAAHCVR